MPTVPFECQQCGVKSDVEVTGTQDDPIATCPACGHFVHVLDDRRASTERMTTSVGPEHSWADFNLALVEDQGVWTVMHRPSGFELGRYRSRSGGLDFGENLINALPLQLGKHPDAWPPGALARLEEIRTEVVGHLPPRLDPQA